MSEATSNLVLGRGPETGSCVRGAASPARTAGERIRAASGAWWVLKTRARNEKRVSEILAERGVEHYLPLAPVHHAYSKRRVTFWNPLFPGYVFLCGDSADCDVAWRTNRVAEILPVADQARLRRELLQVALALESGQPLLLRRGLRIGRRCRIIRGPLRDLEGVLLREARRCQLWLSVTMLGQAATVEVDAALLEPVEPPERGDGEQPGWKESPHVGV